jgi:hypothetical protein
MGDFKIKSLFLAYQEVLNGAELENLPLSESGKDKSGNLDHSKC